MKKANSNMQHFVVFVGCQFINYDVSDICSHAFTVLAKNSVGFRMTCSKQLCKKKKKKITLLTCAEVWNTAND